jgi:hypothetical protein
MKKVSTAAAKQSRNFSGQKLTIGLDLGDRSSYYFWRNVCCETPIISMTFFAMIFSNVSYAACRFVSTGSPASCHA